MTDSTRVSVISTAESALFKLRRANIPVYDCRKEGVNFSFGVKDKDLKKVFAIFSKPCYNIRTEKPSLKKRFFAAALLRIGLIVGAIVFTALAAIADGLVLDIRVSGSGSYLESEIISIVRSEGAEKFKPFSALRKSAATGRILSLPCVVFCNIEKRGAVLTVNVETQNEENASLKKTGLVADRAGKIARISVVCGTALVSEGDIVKAGDILIAPYSENADGERTDCAAVGFCYMEFSVIYEYFAEDDGEKSLKEAYAAALIEESEILSRSHEIKPTEGGVLIVIETEYLRKLSINI